MYSLLQYLVEQFSFPGGGSEIRDAAVWGYVSHHMKSNWVIDVENYIIT
jgi:hypothetical protein